MIIFPNLNDYVSYYKGNDNVITIRIYEYPNKIETKYFNIRTPFPYGAFVEILQKIANQMQLDNLRIEQVTYNSNAEEINIWQLAWFINNIIERKRVLISIEDPNNENISLHTNVYLNDEKDFNRLKEQINHFYDKDFDGLLD